PYISIGAILAAFLTMLIKRLINQQRPPGALSLDPGMPSSHALVSTFMSTAWAVHCWSALVTVPLLAAAATISVLRVACGYHTWAQIGVGALLGGAMAVGWMTLGRAVLAVGSAGGSGTATTVAIYSTYLLGSAFFLAKQFRSKKVLRSSQTKPPL
ncbi:unnamed protein product, partial [Polarella glacialis]